MPHAKCSKAAAAVPQSTSYLTYEVLSKIPSSARKEKQRQKYLRAKVVFTPDFCSFGNVLVGGYLMVGPKSRYAVHFYFL